MGKGNAGYPGPLSITIKHPKQESTGRNYNYNENNQLPGNPNFGRGAAGVVGTIVAGYTFVASEYRGQMEAIKPIAMPRDNTNVAARPLYYKPK